MNKYDVRMLFSVIYHSVVTIVETEGYRFQTPPPLNSKPNSKLTPKTDGKWITAPVVRNFCHYLLCSAIKNIR